MSFSIISFVIICYFGIILLVSRYTVNTYKVDTFFTGDRSSPWYVVTFGMIGASLSGITYISVPGWVGSSQFTYMQMVIGYIPGYIVVAYVLIPIYYKYNVISIYTILEKKYGVVGYKTGSFFFLTSRLIGASARLYIATAVLQKAIFDDLQIPFWINVLITLLFIFFYTKKGGIKTIVWTDIIQTSVMLLSAILIIFALKDELNLTYNALVDIVLDPNTGNIFIWDISKPNYFWKMFLSGALIAIVMTGLDQDMMQKNLTCKNSRASSRNALSLSFILIPVNIMFLCLGALLLKYATMVGVPPEIKGDALFPYIVFNYMSVSIAVLFSVGIISAACSSADSALTALTTAFCVDFLHFNNKKHSLLDKKKMLFRVHCTFLLIIFSTVILFNILNNKSIIDLLFKIAGYTYGPLLGLFIMALYTRSPIDKKLSLWVVVVCILSPCLTYIIDSYGGLLWGNFNFGYLLILINGMICLLCLLIIEFLNNTTNNKKRNVKLL